MTHQILNLSAGFDHQPRTRIVFGAGAIEGVAAFTGELPSTRPLLVTDPGIAAAGHVDRVRGLLARNGCVVTVFDQTRPNPTTEDVDACLAVARRGRIDAIVGLGGGSALDTAKGCNFLLTNGGRMRDYRGIGKTTRPMLPMIAIPTTAGTGSEIQSVALIADATTNQKMACGDPKAAARVAILDPLLSVTQPLNVTACTGIDALAHAVETMVTTARNPLSLIYSREAFRLIHANLPRVMGSPRDIEVRAAMLLGAAYAGFAIENSMLGAAHAAANPLTAHCGITHGQAVGIMLPHVMRFNAESRPPDSPQRATDAVPAYADLARSSGLVSPLADNGAAAGRLLDRVEKVLAAIDLPLSLTRCGIGRPQIADLARQAADQWTARFNPRPVKAADFARLYEAAL